MKNKKLTIITLLGAVAFIATLHAAPAPAPVAPSAPAIATEKTKLQLTPDEKRQRLILRQKSTAAKLEIMDLKDQIIKDKEAIAKLEAESSAELQEIANLKDKAVTLATTTAEKQKEAAGYKQATLDLLKKSAAQTSDPVEKNAQLAQVAKEEAVLKQQEQDAKSIAKEADKLKEEAKTDKTEADKKQQDAKASAIKVETLKQEATVEKKQPVEEVGVGAPMAPSTEQSETEGSAAKLADEMLANAQQMQDFLQKADIPTFSGRKGWSRMVVGPLQAIGQARHEYDQLPQTEKEKNRAAVDKIDGLIKTVQQKVLDLFKQMVRKIQKDKDKDLLLRYNEIVTEWMALPLHISETDYRETAKSLAKRLGVKLPTTPMAMPEAPQAPEAPAE